jgi:hypothetical protein
VQRVRLVRVQLLRPLGRILAAERENKYAGRRFPPRLSAHTGQYELPRGPERPGSRPGSGLLDLYPPCCVAEFVSASTTDLNVSLSTPAGTRTVVPPMLISIRSC